MHVNGSECSDDHTSSFVKSEGVVLSNREDNVLLMTRRWRAQVFFLALSGTLTLLTASWAAAGSTPAIEHLAAGTFIPAPLPSSPSLSPLISPFTINTIKVKGSLNWSGYVQSAKTGIFTSVEDSWTVPTVSTTSSGTQVASDWVGIGGYNRGDSTLVQAGTLSDNMDGTAVYQAWYEILPADAVTLSNVSPGDSITTLVQETSPGTWHLEVTDTTHAHDGGSVTVSYSSSGLSAEAIHERSTICDPTCSIGTLATTSNPTFDPGTVTSTFQATPQPLLVPAIQSEKTTHSGVKTKPDKVYEVVMVQSKPRSTLATPSAPDSDNDGFTVQDGSTAPAPPSS